EAIANEAAIALERANLYDRAAALSRRLFELHRVGLAIAEKTELAEVTKILAESVVDLMKPEVCAVYLDKGGDNLEFAFSTGKATSDVLSLPKTTPTIAKVLETAQPLAFARRSEAADSTRKLLERFGHEALLVHPLRSADQNVGVRLNLTDAELRDLRYASLFHSLGKIGVPAAILSKPGPLSVEERKIMQEHPLLGARILESIRFLRGVVPIVRHANERWDGSG